MIELHGYNLSVYSWIVRFALHEKGVTYDWTELNPFTDEIDREYLLMNPFYRVPTLVDGAFVLYETGSITRYIDEVFDGPALQPSDVKSRAKVNQVISIVDRYTYWPLVRQVFSHDVFRPRSGERCDPAEVRCGLASSERALNALETLVDRQGYIIGPSLTLADIHLAPMLSYFNEADKGRAVLARYGKLRSWFGNVSQRKGFLDSMPVLPAPILE